jgi:hypothetical protein
MLPADLGTPNLQQLLWLMETNTPMQVDPRASAALWASDDLSPPALLPHRNPVLATHSQEPATTHPSECQAPGFAIFWHQEASLTTEHGGEALPTVSDSKRALALPAKEQEHNIPH